MNLDRKHIVEISDQLNKASGSVRILRSVAWPKETKEEFFKYRGKKLPRIQYKPYDPAQVLDQVKSIRNTLGLSDPIDLWAGRIADKIESGALLLASRGTPDFYNHSSNLYGNPTSSLQNGSGNALDLAHHFEEMFIRVKDEDLGAPPQACLLANSVADDMRTVVRSKFGDLSPEIVMDDSLASNVLAGRRRVSIRPTACFTDKDVGQLIHHELYVHVGTSLNGYLQPHLKILGEGHPGTTKTQEGLAVFAELISGSIDLDRARRLSDRVIAIQKAIDGANFLDIYGYYLEKSDNPEQSFENAKRVFRGGVVTGKAPFTKDIVYLEGLINVHNFLRIAISQNKFQYLDLLFAGKLDISDLPVLKQLFEMDLLVKPKFLPPWIEDKRYLLCYLAYSSFTNLDESDRLRGYYQQMLNESI